MQFMPNSKVFLSFGNLTITYYALCIVTGTIIAYQFSKRNIKKMGYNTEILEDLLYGIIPCAIIGARLWYVAFEWEQYASNPISVLYIWQGGLGIYGGIIAGFIFAAIYLKKKKISFLRFADAIVPNILIGQCLGRWGNFFNQEAYGQEVAEYFYDVFPNFIKEKMHINNTYYEPTFLYESVGTLTGWLIINFLYRKSDLRKRGDLFYAYLLWYGMVRFFVEGRRADALFIGPLRVSQLTSIIIVIIGALGILGAFRMIKSKIKPTLLFDNDGTIIDSDELIFESFHYVFNKFYPEIEVTHEMELSFLGPTLEESFSKYAPADADIAAMVECYREHNNSMYESLLKEIPNAKETLKYFHEEGYKIGVVSSKFTDAVKRGLDQLGLSEYVDTIIGRDKMDVFKPDPDGLYKACDALGCGYDYVVYVGDSDTDMQAGLAAGAYTVGVTWTAKGREVLDAEKPDAMIEDISDLKELVKKVQYRGDM